MSVSHDGYNSAPRTLIEGRSRSNAVLVWAIVTFAPHVLPASGDVLVTTLLWAQSCQATCTSPLGETNGSAAISPFLPVRYLLARTGAEKVRPRSVDRDTNTAAFLLPPTWSKAT